MTNKNIFLIYKELLQFNKKNIQETKCVKDMERQFIEEDTQIIDKGKR